MNDIRDTLAERQHTHGNFDDNSIVAQQIKLAIRGSGAQLTPAHMEALDIIATKIGRICSGSAGYHDHWDDIAGYATLAADRCHPELPLTLNDLFNVRKILVEEQRTHLQAPTGWRLMDIHERVDTLTRGRSTNHGWIEPHTSLLGQPVADAGCRCITPVWHNPTNLESPGEGYRFLLTSETRQDATHCTKTGNDWDEMRAKDDGSTALFPGLTYRTNKPLPCPPTTN